MTQRWILPLALAALAFTGCTTAYKTGQTPDDVYYSPARPQDEYVKVEEDQDRYGQYADEYYDDRYLRMKVHNRSRWTELNDWYVSERPYNYYGHTYSYYGGCFCNDPWTPYAYWNNVYNPYYHPYIVVSPRSNPVAYNHPRTFNLNTYTPVSNPAFNYSNPKYNTYNYSNNNNPSVTNPTRTNTRSSSGNVLRNIFGGSNNSGSSSSSSGNHTSSGSSSSGSSSSGSSSSGSSAPVRRF